MSLAWKFFLPVSNDRHQDGHSDCEGRLAEEAGVLLEEPAGRSVLGQTLPEEALL